MFVQDTHSDDVNEEIGGDGVFKSQHGPQCYGGVPLLLTSLTGDHVVQGRCLLISPV